jgi:hypothetical protein
MAYRPIPRERLSALRKTYSQLCEWLNMENEHLTRCLLDGHYVRPFFEEYCQDFLSRGISSSSSSRYSHDSDSDSFSVVDCDDLYQWCISTNAFEQPKYVGRGAVDKNGWTALE